MEELPQTTGQARRPGLVETPGAITLAEAVETWQVSHRTLRRRLAANEIPGAYKVAGGKGEEWRIPAGALDQLGYTRQTPDTPPEPAAPPPPPLPTPAERIAADLARLLEKERLALSSANDQYAEAKAEAARLEERLKAARAETDRERERADQLAAELAEATAPRRRWWRK